MKTVGWALLTSSFMAIVACGSHNHAPVVYGADPARQTRVYHSPEDIYRAREARETQTAQVYQKPVYKAQSAAVEPAQLTPVKAVYLDDAVRQPVSAPPAHLHKAKGYIEVQRGDTVYAISRRFNVTPASLIDANDLKQPYSLKVGQVLKLPKGATAVAVDAPTRRVAAQDKLHTVRSGETLYGISRASGVPVSNIASANNLRAPYTLSVGQRLVIPQAPVTAFDRPATSPTPAKTQRTVERESKPTDLGDISRTVSYTKPEATSDKSLFSWPVRGAIISEYGSGNLGRRNDGVNIAAPVGSPVRAAADGQVVYRGSELEGFGNLLLVKHQDGFVTAYAHNDAMLVKKGDYVRKGQLIAKVGQTGAVTTPQLHFEIRQDSKTVDPVALLGKQ
ncbi:peptidoglycan DD-metalloendopeptidase family protein [Hyphococcus sp. DH-69]|uniref:peptidoglycan DD-metalloendopeptidase family protein n=1 Tax=Hyphococcus formosus TaxID=3143534 RepID=UPI00398AEC37